MRIAIMVDDWKVPIFREKLTKAGFVFKIGKDRTIPKDTTAFIVETTEKDRLQFVVMGCQRACKASQN